MAQVNPRFRQLHLDGFGTFLQARGAPEDVLERARAFGHVALRLACRSPAAANDTDAAPVPASEDVAPTPEDGAGRG